MTDEDIANAVLETELEASLNLNTPITPEEVAVAKQEIYKLHPLSRLEVREVMPTCAVFMSHCCCCITSKRAERIAEEKKIIAEESAEQNRTLNGILSAYGVSYHGTDYVRDQLPQHYNNDGSVAPD